MTYIIKVGMFNHRSTGRSVYAITACLILLLFATTSAFAQVRPALTGKIPFEFTMNNKSLPAGSYQFVAVPGTPWLSVTGSRGKITVPVITKLAPNPDLRDAMLVFDKIDDRHVISEVWIPGEGGFLVHATPQGHTHETLIAVQSGLSDKLSGKQVFERTCARCHGPDGAGNLAADKFFQTTIPRLNSDLVQTKSDDELREIVTKGRRKMDPVRVGQSTVQHLLPTESVDAVLAYVRTFKKT